MGNGAVLLVLFPIRVLMEGLALRNPCGSQLIGEIRLHRELMSSW
jgi:hypothetical protein